MVKKYIPKQGDIILVNLSPTSGHEQNGFRTAIVISNNIFNEKTNMSIVCPITSNINVKFIEKASENDLLSVVMLTNACIEN